MLAAGRVWPAEIRPADRCFPKNSSIRVIVARSGRNNGHERIAVRDNGGHKLTGVRRAEPRRHLRVHLDVASLRLTFPRCPRPFSFFPRGGGSCREVVVLYQRR